MQHEIYNLPVALAYDTMLLRTPAHIAKARHQQAKMVASCACLEGVQLFHEVLNAEPGHFTLQLLRQVLKHLKC